MDPDALKIQVKGENVANSENLEVLSRDATFFIYEETECERSTVKACGNFCFIFLGLCLLSWFVHAIPVQTITDIPPFANSLLYLSIAHHTNQWEDDQNSVSPPPPMFGDGKGNFPST